MRGPVNLPADIKSTWELSDAERMALPAAYHQPVWDDLGQPHSWLCSQCWSGEDAWTTAWPCEVAQRDGRAVAEAGGMEVST